MAAPPAPHRRRRRREIGKDHQRSRQADLVGGVAADGEQCGEDLGGRLAGEEQATTVELHQLHQLHLHAGHDTEVPAASAQRPEQVGVVVGGHPPRFAVGGDDVEPAHPIGGETPPPAEDAEAAAECVGHGADSGRRARQRRLAERRGLV